MKVTWYPYRPTKRDWQIILYGDPDNPTNGGHLFGVGRERKTETDATWSAERFQAAIQATIDAPDKRPWQEHPYSESN